MACMTFNSAFCILYEVSFQVALLKLWSNILISVKYHFIFIFMHLDQLMVSGNLARALKRLEKENFQPSIDVMLILGLRAQTIFVGTVCV